MDALEMMDATALIDADVTGGAQTASKRGAPSDEDTALGAQLRQRRKAQGLNLKDVADQAGLSLSLLSQIERGLSSPSMRVLRQLCHVLRMDGATLFADPSSVTIALAAPADLLSNTATPHDRYAAPVTAPFLGSALHIAGQACEADYVVRRDERRAISVAGIKKYRVTPRHCAAMEGFLLEISAGSASDPEYAWQTGDKIAYVLSGRLTLYVNDIVIALDAGDVYGFSSGHRYRWENSSTALTTLLVINGDHFYV